jgi:hypothetical protein
VDEPDQLASRQYEGSPVLVASGLAKLLTVIGTELRRRKPHRVGGLHQIDVGNVAAFVASDRARSMTAATDNVSCGALVD